jgi:lysophospholipase L1-like esterase
MVALGSSYAAGPGLEPVADRAAGRSTVNYPHLVAAALGAHLTDATVSGATTDTILHTPQRTLRGRFAPQIESVGPATDLVTVTAGGNDLGYIGGIMGVGALHHFAASRVWGSVASRRLQRRTLEPLTPEAVQKATDGLAAIVEESRRRASDAVVVLVDYLPVFNAETPAEGTGLTPDEIAHFRRIADHLSAAYREAAATTGALLVPASAYEPGHGVGSADPWVGALNARSLRGFSSSYHPTAVGMRAVADRVIALLEHPTTEP